MYLQKYLRILIIKLAIPTIYFYNIKTSLIEKNEVKKAFNNILNYLLNL
jgi:hypothetical protein